MKNAASLLQVTHRKCSGGSIIQRETRKRSPNHLLQPGLVDVWASVLVKSRMLMAQIADEGFREAIPISCRG